MRIGMILDKPFPPDPRVANEASALIDAGFEVFLFCLTYKNESDIVIDGLSVKRYRSDKIEYKLSALAYTFPFYRMMMQPKIADFLQKNHIEAIHIHDMRIAGAVFKVNEKFGLPVVLDLHDNMPEVIKDYPHLKRFPGKYLIDPEKWKQEEEVFIRKADKVITVSPEFVDAIVKRTAVPAEKVVLVPNTVRKSFFEDAAIDPGILQKYSGDFVLLYLGDTGLRRGLLTAITAMPVLAKKIPHLKLVIVGASSADTELKNKVKELKLDEVVVFEGWQDVQLFPSYIRAGAVCISPLHRSKQHDVAYANKLFQYMSFGKPLLVSDATAQKHLVEKINSGLVHREKDPEDFAEKVLQLYNNPEDRKTWGINGKRFIANEFVWEKVSGNLVAIYKAFEENTPNPEKKQQM